MNLIVFRIYFYSLNKLYRIITQIPRQTVRLSDPTRFLKTMEGAIIVGVKRNEKKIGEADWVNRFCQNREMMISLAWKLPTETSLPRYV